MPLFRRVPCSPLGGAAAPLGLANPCRRHSCSVGAGSFRPCGLSLCTAGRPVELCCWSARPGRGHHAPSGPHRALSSLSSFRGPSLSAKAERWSAVKVERKGESLSILSAALSWKHLQILQSLMRQLLQSLLRYLIVQHIFTSFFQTSARGVYFPIIHVGLDHVTCFG